VAGKTKVILKDLRDRRFLDGYGGFLLALTVVTVNVIAAFVTTESKLTTLVNGTIVALLGLLVSASIDIRRGLPGAGTSAGKVWRFYADRGELPQMKEQIEGSVSLIEIYGLQLGTVTHSLLPAIRIKAAAGCKVHLALLSPVDGNGVSLSWIPQIGSVHGFPDLDAQLRANISQLKQWHGALPPEIRKNVEIRAYSRIPTASVIISDAERRTGYVHVEPILHEFAPTERPIFWIREQDDQSLFRLLVSHYGDLWKSATPIDRIAL
jgi:hypothetical protein